ncbi:MAG: hypothetical protein WD554_06500 [Flavobacteriaceae bacterium]
MKKLLFLFLLLLFPITNSFACSCIEVDESFSKKVEGGFSKSDLIITGKVVDINTEYVENNKPFGSPILYRFEIIKKLKGNLEKEVVEIISEVDSSMCGYKFEFGKSYLVYAINSTYYSSLTNKEFDFVTSLCSRNQILKNVKKKELQKLKKLNRKEKK